MIDWEMFTVSLFVAGAVGYILHSLFLTWKGSKSSCGSGCGRCGNVVSQKKDPEGTWIPLDQVKLRPRG